MGAVEQYIYQNEFRMDPCIITSIYRTIQFLHSEPLKYGCCRAINIS